MIVKILGKSATFKGVIYNLDKADRDRGDLMKVSGFDSLLGLANHKAQDYVNYLAAVSARSPKIVYPQFHAIISCKGRSKGGPELAEIAEKWLKGMGYGDQPYIVVFHRDTPHNHVHLVSTRVGRNGLKISDSFERVKSYQVLNQILGLDSKQSVKTDIGLAMSYNFSTKAQFALLLENMGYQASFKGPTCHISKFGTVAGEVPLKEIEAKVLSYKKDKNRLSQLRAIVHKYKAIHNPALEFVGAPVAGRANGGKPCYRSALSEMVSEKLGVGFVFHGKQGKMPYGYSVIDHAKRAVYKGSELMPLADFIGGEMLERNDTDAIVPQVYDQPASIEEKNPNSFDGQTPGLDVTNAGYWAADIGPDIADDVDDEAVLGMKRRKKLKARTNTR